MAEDVLRKDCIRVTQLWDQLVYAECRGFGSANFEGSSAKHETYQLTLCFRRVKGILQDKQRIMLFQHDILQTVWTNLDVSLKCKECMGKLHFTQAASYCITN